VYPTVRRNRRHRIEIAEEYYEQAEFAIAGVLIAVVGRGAVANGNRADGACGASQYYRANSRQKAAFRSTGFGKENSGGHISGCTVRGVGVVLEGSDRGLSRRLQIYQIIDTKIRY